MDSYTIDMRTLMDMVDEVRHDRRMTWTQTAQEIGVSSSYLSRLWTGYRDDTTASILLSILAWLSLPVYELGTLIKQITVRR